MADPFSNDAFSAKVQKIHVRIQRNGNRHVTTLQGLDEDLDHARIAKAMKKRFNCNGNVKEDETYGLIIQLQGDQRDACVAWLLEQEILTQSDVTERLVIHGF